MSSSIKTDEKINENYNIINKEDKQRDFNDIKIIKRTLENNTHEVIQDSILKKITSWRKSKRKFFQSLIYNILSLGIIHLISLCYPNLFIKLYCKQCEPKDCDYFLVEDLYGYFSLCLKIHKKRKNNKDLNSDISKETLIYPLNYTNHKLRNNLIKNLTYSFRYKSMIYEYDDETNEISPVYMNLSKMTNEEILNHFNEGFSKENLVKKYKDRYGANEYSIDADLLYIYFKRVELPNFIIVLIIAIIEFFLKDYISFIIKIITIFVLLFKQYIIVKRMTLNIEGEDYTLEGKELKLKVKRKYLIKDDNTYAEIKNSELLPGDIVYLKSKDIVPCDCILIEGECIANENNLNGNLDMFRKTSIENNKDKFDYKLNNINILFHGMKIVKTISKLNNGFISVLCINTGANTYKANQYSNILNLSERKKEHKNLYEFFGKERKEIIIVEICIFFLSLLLGVCFIFIFQMKVTKIKELLPFILIRILCKSLMPVYYITNSIIIISSVIRLKSENIFCYDKSRLLNNAGKIDTIVFSKTGTLSENIFEINGYHPVYINPNKINSITYKAYNKNKCKEMNIQVLKYYKEYLYKNNNITDNEEYNFQHIIKSDKKQSYTNKLKNITNESIALFMECLLSCNNIDKFNKEIYGNIIETTIFNEMNWDIKVYDYNESIYNNELNNDNSKITTKRTNKFFYNNKFVFVDKKISDIFPKNYYKITEPSKDESISRKNSSFIMKKFTNNSNNFLKQTNLKNGNNSYLMVNPILTDVSSCSINSYKLRIYKRFIIYGTLNSSAIVYNFMTKELRFMIKGMAEDILDKCDKNSLPDNFENTISFYRKNGFIIIIYATKLINIEEYNDFNNYNYYLNNLKFCGFITLKTILKKETKKSIKDLMQFKCNLIITSGDNEYNSLSIGFDSGIIENKNVFVFDRDDNNNRIIIKKIYSVKNNKEYNNNENDDIKSNLTNEKYSKKNKINQFKINQTPLYKENSLLKNSDIFIRSSQTKKYLKPKMDFNNQIKEIEDRKVNLTPINKTKKYYQIISKKRISFMDRFKLSKLTKENSEKEILKHSLLNSDISEINYNQEKSSNSNKTKNKKNKDINSFKNNKIIFNGKNNLGEFERFYYHYEIFRENEDLKENCIYCVSGKLLNYLYKNKKKKECKYLLEKIHKYCKIFFSMSSIDKSILIDFFKDYPNSYICNIGECQSDFDSIYSSNVGINLKEPKNLNTLLCHFYSADSNIICIKKIIMEGRIVDENVHLMRVSSYFCTMIINSYIITCFIRNTDVIKGQLNFLEIILVLFSVLSFTVTPDNNYAQNPLVKDIKLFNFHYYVQIVGMFIFKLLAVYFASYFNRENYDLTVEELDKIFCTHYFMLCIELIFSIISAFKFISFSTKSRFSNPLFIIFILLLLFYYVNLISLNNSNYREDYFNITYFEYQEKLIDSFDEHNKILLISVCLVDFIISIFYSRFIYMIFLKIAKYKLSKKENS